VGEIIIEGAVAGFEGDVKRGRASREFGACSYPKFSFWQTRVESRSFVPERQLKIAQRFIAGLGRAIPAILLGQLKDPGDSRGR
jgi:hypothetical protein